MPMPMPMPSNIVHVCPMHGQYQREGWVVHGATKSTSQKQQAPKQQQQHQQQQQQQQHLQQQHLQQQQIQIQTFSREKSGLLGVQSSGELHFVKLFDKHLANGIVVRRVAASNVHLRFRRMHHPIKERLDQFSAAGVRAKVNLLKHLVEVVRTLPRGTSYSAHQIHPSIHPSEKSRLSKVDHQQQPKPKPKPKPTAKNEKSNADTFEPQQHNNTNILVVQDKTRQDKTPVSSLAPQDAF